MKGLTTAPSATAVPTAAPTATAVPAPVVVPIAMASGNQVFCSTYAEANQFIDSWRFLDSNNPGDESLLSIFDGPIATMTISDARSNQATATVQGEALPSYSTGHLR
ncbi:MAG: hypothetical protein ACKVHY_02485 [Candidatus Nanopelagicales bacterium]